MAHSLKQDLRNFKDGWHPSIIVPEKQEDIEGQFKRGNLLIKKPTRDIVRLRGIWPNWRVQEATSLLILAKAYLNNGSSVYIAKMSKSSRPTLTSKGHYIYDFDTKEVEMYFKLSIASAFKDL